MWWWQLLSQSALPRRTSASPSVSVTAGTESPALSPELLELQHHPLKIWTWPHNSPFLLLEFFYYLQFQKLCPSVMKSLTHWYPIISSCPRQRRNSPDPFAACASAWPKMDHERIAPTSSSTWIWTYPLLIQLVIYGWSFLLPPCVFLLLLYGKEITLTVQRNQKGEETILPEQ